VYSGYMRDRGLASSLLLGLTVASVAAAQNGGTAGTALASASATQAPTAPADPRTAQIRALIAGTLDVSIAPQSLFDVSLNDEDALRVEAARIRSLLGAVQSTPAPADSTRTRSKRPATERLDASNPVVPPNSIAPQLWTQRLDLDRARLDFLELAPDQRKELLKVHTARQDAARPKETDEQRRAREAEAERARALEAAKVARTEAERTVSEELARLIALDARVQERREEFKRARDEIAVRREALLGWQRRVRGAKASSSVADTTYDALRRALRGTRQDLSAALDALDDRTSRVPSLGPDRLLDLPPDIPTATVRERRTIIARAIAGATREERTLRVDSAAALLDEVNALNRARLGLLPYLSPEKRNAITGFTLVGWDQAGSEARHLSLVLRYHQHAAQAWLRGLKDGNQGEVSALRIGLRILPEVLLIAVFFWARRRSQVVLRWFDLRLAAADRAERRTTPSIGSRAIRMLLKVHRPIEWLLFFTCVWRLLPSGARSLLEVELISSVVNWTLVGSLIVNTVNALFATEARGAHSAADDSAALRLRSLQLVGRTVIVFALILVLSSRLVGEGTIYSWVFSSCWFAAVPVFLLLVRWWRTIVFDRLDRLRKKSPLQAWILGNRSGWKSFAAATLGAVQLFVSEALKLGRGWLSSFDLARRVHAYLFKREIERIGEGRRRSDLDALSDQVLAKLHPGRPFDHWLSCACDGLRDALIERTNLRQGGVISVVATRGMGKSSLLRVIAQRAANSQLIEWRAEPGASDLRAQVDLSRSIILVDDAQAMIEPRIGGLAKFDEAVAVARAHSQRTTWVFAFDASVWPLLKRARDARPTFDEVHVLGGWDEDELGALLTARCQLAGIDPQYDALLERLPPGSDELDRQDALLAKRAGYERMLWDHVGGNPGLALEAFRESLVQDRDGVVHVQPLKVPDLTKIEKLPDASLFVLRAVLQLAPTTAEKVSLATRLRLDDVIADVRYGTAQGYYAAQAHGIEVAWPWLRAVSRHLERRHLLLMP